MKCHTVLSWQSSGSVGTLSEPTTVTQYDLTISILSCLQHAGHLLWGEHLAAKCNCANFMPDGLQARSWAWHTCSLAAATGSRTTSTRRSWRRMRDAAP